MQFGQDKTCHSLLLEEGLGIVAGPRQGLAERAGRVATMHKIRLEGMAGTPILWKPQSSSILPVFLARVPGEGPEPLRFAFSLR